MQSMTQCRIYLLHIYALAQYAPGTRTLLMAFKLGRSDSRSPGPGRGRRPATRISKPGSTTGHRDRRRRQRSESALPVAVQPGPSSGHWRGGASGWVARAAAVCQDSDGAAQAPVALAAAAAGSEARAAAGPGARRASHESVALGVSSCSRARAKSRCRRISG